jgi:hypothetical protein
MDDAAGLRFVVLGPPEILEAVSDATRDIWRCAGALVLPGEGTAYLEELGCKCVIVRPDRYILAAASSATELDAATALIPLARN